MAVENVAHQQIGKLSMVHAGQHDHTNFLLRKHAHGGCHAGRVSSVLPHQLVPIILHDPTHAVRIEQSLLAAARTTRADDHLRDVGFAQRCATHQSLAVDDAVVQLESEPLCHVGRIRKDGSRRRNVLRVELALSLHGIVVHRVRRGEVGCLDPAIGRRTRGHAERREDALLDEIVPCAAGCLTGRLACGEIQDVLIRPSGPKY